LASSSSAVEVTVVEPTVNVACKVSNATWCGLSAWKAFWLANEMVYGYRKVWSSSRRVASSARIGGGPNVPTFGRLAAIVLIWAEVRPRDWFSV